jgi:hypothetical protein
MWRAGHTGFTAGLCRQYFHDEIRSAHHRACIRAARWLLRPAALDHAGAPTKSPARGRGFGDNGKAISIANRRAAELTVHADSSQSN